MSPLAVLVAASVVLVAGADAQCAEWDARLGSVPGMDAPVACFEVFDDGSGPALYAGGSFTEAGGAKTARVARWDGTSWSPVGVLTQFPLNHQRVAALEVFDDGSGPALYAAGDFGIKRWSGSSWSAVAMVGITTGWGVRSLAVFDDGSGSALYAGGDFYSIGGSVIPVVARWDGTTWSPVGQGFLQTSGIGVACFEVFDDGTGPALYAAGDFLGTPPISNIARWDGTSWSPVGSLPNNLLYAVRVHDLAVFDDGGGPRLFVGGQREAPPGQGVVWTWDGAIWSLPFGATFDSSVLTLTVHDLGSGPVLYAGGRFTEVAGVQAMRVARLDLQGWLPLAEGFEGAGTEVSCLRGFDDGASTALYAGGTFTTAGDDFATYVARYDGSAWSAPGGVGPLTGTNGPIEALCRFGAGAGAALYAGGSFTIAGATDAHHIARWEGAGWSPLGAGPGGTDGPVRALAVFDDGGGEDLYAGGTFTTAGGAPAANVARWDGVGWSPLGSGVDGTVSCLATFDDGTGVALYAGGEFQQAGGNPAPFLARWDGASWSPLSGGVLDGAVRSLAVYDAGTGPALHAGGEFATAGGAAAPHIARWDGATWSPLGPPGSGTNGSVLSLAVFDGGSGPDLYVGGEFILAGGGLASHVARWDGSGWSALSGANPIDNGTNGVVRSLAVFDDGSGPDLYVGGGFLTVPGLDAARLARWDGTQWSTAGDPFFFGGHVRALAAFDDGGDGDADLYVGGTFTGGGHHFARWHGCGTTAFCFGDGSGVACPCGNDGDAGRGCENSVSTGGARLEASGTSQPDQLVLTSSGELASSLSIFLQGTVETVPAPFGDGLRCAGGNLKRLYAHGAIAGVASAPQPGEASITDRSAALGDPIAPGSSRFYQTYYRDPDPGFCPSPQGSTFNASNALRVVW